ncbi:hypothetical protein J2Y86_005332 [Pseudomonas migulae]|jgi:hypothetical protein|uniref:hypothetical protein n=1 Tax=Pseudomonas migulae TaxID=78543 RepID=UPI0020A22ADF|nr:hypothetical protein [Pseudomonas migulae]MCP1500625.1 hypothetical protein [Pseudomonas migulae]
MNNFLDKDLDYLSALLVIAQQRLDTLKQTVSSANETASASDIRIAIGDAITPLNIAYEAAETL